MATGGIICSTSADSQINYTYAYLNLDNTISADGTLISACIKLNNGVVQTVFTSSCSITVLTGDIVGVSNASDGTRRIFIVRDDGTNYIFIGSVTISTPSPYNNHDVGILTSGSNAHKSGDVTGNTLKSDWTVSGVYRPIVYVYSGLGDVYIDINKADDTGDGTAFATAKKTMKAGWDILNALGTMHVASGNYSAQTRWTWNKSWKLSPEDPNTTGEKRVVIPPST